MKHCAIVVPNETVGFLLDSIETVKQLRNPEVIVTYTDIEDETKKWVNIFTDDESFFFAVGVTFGKHYRNLQVLDTETKKKQHEQSTGK